MKSTEYSLFATAVLMLVLISCGGERIDNSSASDPHPKPGAQPILPDTPARNIVEQSPSFTGTAEEALRLGLVEIEGKGKNTFRQIQANVRNLTSKELNLELDAGMYFDNPRSKSQNLVILEDYKMQVGPGQSVAKTLNSACTDAEWSVPRDDDHWPVEKAPKNLDGALKFYGQHEDKISAYLKKKNPEQLGTAGQQQQFKQVMVWAYMGDNYDDIRRMLAQEVFNNDLDRAEDFLSEHYSDAQEIADLVREQDSAAIRQYFANKSAELIAKGKENAKGLLDKSKKRLQNWRSN